MRKYQKEAALTAQTEKDKEAFISSAAFILSILSKNGFTLETARKDVVSEIRLKNGNVDIFLYYGPSSWHVEAEISIKDGNPNLLMVSSDATIPPIQNETDEINNAMYSEDKYSENKVENEVIAKTYIIENMLSIPIAELSKYGYRLMS